LGREDGARQRRGILRGVVRKGEIWCSAAMPESAVQTSAETVATRAGWTLTVATPVSHTLDHFSS